MDMDQDQIQLLICDFGKENHGSTNYDEESLFIMGREPGQFAPFGHIRKKVPTIKNEKDLMRMGYVYGHQDTSESTSFADWFQKQFSRKLTIKDQKRIYFLYRFDEPLILETLNSVNNAFNLLKDQRVLINSKSLPTQLGEWYAKTIFGLKQVKSTSQRGFDFELDGHKTEVIVHWKLQGHERSTLIKGIKIKKSLVQICQTCILVYLSPNLMIKELCLLDSDFVLRKFTDKGHTLFLKEEDISMYFFGHSFKHYDKIVNKKSLLNFSTPSFSLKLEEKFKQLEQGRFHHKS